MKTGQDHSRPSTPGAIDISTPSIDNATSHRQLRARTSTSLVKSLLNPIVSLLPRLRSRRRADEEGIIAPRTPVRGSPLHSPVEMPKTSYFPWGDDAVPSSKSNNYPINLAPNHSSLRGMRQSPPPPRRVQSELSLSKGADNARGLATRGGKPVVSDAQFAGGSEGMSNGSGFSAGMERSASAETASPAMGLGPKGRDQYRGADVLDSQLRSRRKGD